MPDNVIILNRTPDDWQRLFRQWFQSGKFLLVLLFLVLFGFLGNPFFVVGQNEQGVVLRFGRQHRTTLPGAHLKLPWPIESVILVDVQQIKRLEIGFRSGDSSDLYRGTYQAGRARQPVEGESLMLTGDENIIRVELEAQYRILDPVKYLFEVVNPEDTLMDIGEATLRRVIGDYGVDSALTEGKGAIEEEIKVLIQELADRYQMGIEVQTVNLVEAQAPMEVQPAFQAVISAKEEKQKIRNEAQGYRNGEMPKAEGAAAALVNAASAYAIERVLKAQGEIERFSALLAEYSSAEKVTRDRLYLEVLEEVLADVELTIVDRELDQVLPLMDLTRESKPSLGGGGGQP